MRLFRFTGAVVVLSMVSAAMPARAEQGWEVWTVDPLTNLFRDAEAPELTRRTAEGLPVAVDEEARGQMGTFQFAVRSETALKKLHCEVTDFVDEKGSGALGGGAVVVRFVGYVHVPAKDVGHPGADRLRASGEFPDPLLVDKEMDVPARTTQGIWVTVRVPVEARPGVYVARARVGAENSDHQSLQASVTLRLTVHRAAIESVRFKNSNFFHLFHGYGWTPMPEAYSEGYWKLLRTFAKNMAEHRQMVCRTVPLRLAQYSWDAAGKLSVDFSRMDQWIRIFQEEGIKLFEGQQIGWRRDDWKSPYMVSVYVPADDARARDPKLTRGTDKVIEDTGWAEIRVAPDSEDAEKFYSQFLPQFQAHLEKLGLLETFMQHLGDEPIDANIASHQKIGALVKKYAPKLKRIDARLTDKGTEAVDVLVPILGDLHTHYDEYRKLQASGQELWFYTCVNPQGNYVNRFVSMPLIKSRLLFWVAYRYHVTGHLHWGYDYWAKDKNPFTEPRLPVGDANIVYPGPDFTVLDSIRWEAYRDGVEDHELLSQLGERDAEAAERLVEREVLDFDKYNTDIAALRATRHEMLELLDR